MATFDRQPAPVADLIAKDPMFNHRPDGSLVQRERVCECGKRFVQSQLSPRFMEIVELVGKSSVDAVVRGVPDLFVPVHCPHCERIDLGRQARIDQHRADYPDPRAQREAAD